MKYLMIDFGSTFTKLTAVDTELEDVIATSAHFTTVATDITIGYENALKELYKKLGEEIKFDKLIACSSAAGGLKMAAIGLVEELTVEAAKRVCLGAGAKVDLVFSHHLTSSEIESIKEKNIDIILLAGGTDGGNTECAIYNCNALGEKGIKIPVVFAGNKCCVDEIKEIYQKYQMNGYICENVMPKINVLNLPSAREKIRELFLTNIIEAKGIKKIENTIDKVILPTPEAVLSAAELLSKGYMHESGLGEIVLVDIGGATTDFYSMSSPSAKRSDVIIKGLEEPYAKRTVEGDLGMRYSATGIAATLTTEEKRMFKEDQGIDIDEEAKFRNTNVDMVFEDERGKNIDTIFAGICCDKAISRHVGIMEEVYSPIGVLYNQTGKDLSQVSYVIGTGGVLIHNDNPVKALKKVMANRAHMLELRPVNPKFMLDKDYLLASMGLLSSVDPLLALKIMKKHMIEIIEK